MKITDTKQHFSRVINEVARGEARIVVEKNGLRAAVLISPEEYDRFVALEDARLRHVSEFARVATEFSRGFDDVSGEELEAELGRIRREFRELTDKERTR